MIRTILIICALQSQILMPSWFRISPPGQTVYIAGIAPRYYTIESSYKEAREDALMEMNLMNGFTVKGSRGWIRDFSSTLFAGQNIQCEYDTLYLPEDSLVESSDSIVLDSIVYYLIKQHYPEIIPSITNCWWDSLPEIPGWYLSIGIFSDPYGVTNGWNYAEDKARTGLTNYYVYLKSLDKQLLGESYKQEITVESLNITIKHSIILGRHYKDSMYYALAGVPVKYIELNDEYEMGMQ